MRRLYPPVLFIGLSLLGWLSASVASAQYPPHASGKELFLREWQSNAAGALEGDGLGPLFNARSCVACHHLGGTGGAGGNEHNVDLLSLVGPRGKLTPRRAERLNLLARQIHPGIAGRTNLVLHKQSTDAAYASWRNQLLAPAGESTLELFGTHDQVKVVRLDRNDVLKIGALQFRVTQRNTPPLFGAGLIDSISRDTLITVAKQQLRTNRALAGRVPADGGRFGWRGQMDNLREFVAGACANELGLETPDHPQPIDPRQPTYQNVRVDMGDWEVTALTDFIRELPPPELLRPQGTEEVLSWQRGQQLFHAGLCSQCHLPRLDHVVGIYSDLLLHDMGPSLSDPVPSPEPISLTEPVIVSSPSGGSYNGGGPTTLTTATISEPSNTEQLWRTPPLWGVRDSAPYLHDGRAATIAEAIEMHDGQGKRSADFYRQLDEAAQGDLLRFVHSLGVPAEMIPQSLPSE